jgi:hypothetical protein
MTPEERREAHLHAIAQDETPYLGLLAYLDEHQPFTAKLLREGDPEGLVADVIRYGLDAESHAGRQGWLYDVTEFINYPEGREK